VHTSRHSVKSFGRDHNTSFIEHAGENDHHFLCIHSIVILGEVSLQVTDKNTQHCKCCLHVHIGLITPVNKPSLTWEVVT
jgi:hypothetical protein